MKDAKGRLALHLAVKKGSAQAVRFLVEKGYGVNVQDKKGRTPAHMLAQYHDVLEKQGRDANTAEILRFLVANPHS